MSGLPDNLRGLPPAEKRALLARLLAERGRRAPTSFAQRRIWFLAQLAPDDPSYNNVALIEIRGVLDAAALASGLEAMAERHETLRTTFEIVDDEPVQRIAPTHAITLPMVDFSVLSAAAATAASERQAALEVRRPFDLTRLPLLRMILLRLAPDRHVLVTTIHHVISDGWSMRLLIGELTELYRARVEGREMVLSDLPIQYADYAHWQRQRASSPDLRAQLDDRLRQLHELPMLELPTDRPRPPVRRGRGLTRSVVLAQSLVDLGRTAGATPFMVLLGLFEVLLGRLSGQLDFAVGTPVSNRDRVELEGLIGVLINSVALRVDLSGDPTVVELLERVRMTTLQAFEHRDVPFETVVDELKSERTTRHTPVFQVMFQLDQEALPRVETAGLELIARDRDTGSAKFDLALVASETEDGFDLVLEADRDLFDATSVDRMLVAFRQLASAAAAEPHGRLSRLDLLPPGQRHQLLCEWNDTADSPPPDLATLLTLSGKAGMAAISEGSRRVSYVELEGAVARLAARLRRHGTRPESRVAIFLERSTDALVALMAVLRVGGAFVPLDPAQPADRLRTMLTDSDARLVITRQEWQSSPALGGQELLLVDTEEEAAPVASDPLPAVAADPRALAYVIFTSGSTGRPKGVMVSRQAFANYLDWARRQYAVAGGSGSLAHTPLMSDLTLTSLFLPIIAGRTVRLLEASADAEDLVAEVRIQDDLSWLKLTPTHLELLAQLLPAEALEDRARVLVLGGESLTWNALGPWLDGAPETRYVNEYGPTETVVGCCYDEARATARQGSAAATGSVPIGRPIRATQLYVVDALARPQPGGCPGELWIGGAGVARGYLGRAALTAEAFVPDPFARRVGARLYRSGDRCRYRADGRLEFLGRIDQQLKIRGYRVEPGEVEAALAALPAVREAAVLARDSNAGRRLVAYLVQDESVSQPRLDELRTELLRVLPDYMVPAQVVWLEQMPLAKNGKLDRSALPAPDDRRPELATTYVTPKSAIERSIAAVWQELLQVDRVGVDDNFFDLGGHSLLLVSASRRLAAELDVELRLVDFFTYTTVGALAEHVRRLRQGLATARADAPRDRTDAVSAGKDRRRDRLARRRGRGGTRRG